MKDRAFLSFESSKILYVNRKRDLFPSKCRVAILQRKRDGHMGLSNKSFMSRSNLIESLSVIFRYYRQA